jgi:phospholipid/cholesterol/gamma-HCH transport system substrate-binding protein
MGKKGMVAIAAAFIAIGICTLAWLPVILGKLDISYVHSYEVQGGFDSVAGLKEGATVEIAGVVVGRVERINLDQKKKTALVTMRIRQGTRLTDDVIASVRTRGILGDKFILLAPGGSDRFIADKGKITDTESAIDLTELVKKFVNKSTK